MTAVEGSASKQNHKITLSDDIEKYSLAVFTMKALYEKKR